MIIFVTLIKLLHLTADSVGNKLSDLTFSIHASLNKSFTCKTNGHISHKGSRNITNNFEIFLFVTGNDSAFSIISENVKINSYLLLSHSIS